MLTRSSEDARTRGSPLAPAAGKPTAGFQFLKTRTLLRAQQGASVMADKRGSDPISNLGDVFGGFIDKTVDVGAQILQDVTGGRSSEKDEEK